MVSRKQKAVQSIQTWVRDILVDEWHYTPDKVQLLDAFPEDKLATTLDRTYVASGFEFDDGGEQAELGSGLTRKVYNVTFWVFGATATWGQNVADAIASAMERDGRVPLLDIGTAQPDVVIDQLLLLPSGSLRSQRMEVRDPRPWERNLWRVLAKYEDYYTPIQ